jgi:hypothetical protein
VNFTLHPAEGRVNATAVARFPVPIMLTVSGLVVFAPLRTAGRIADTAP